MESGASLELWGAGLIPGLNGLRIQHYPNLDLIHGLGTPYAMGWAKQNKIKTIKPIHRIPNLYYIIKKLYQKNLFCTMMYSERRQYSIIKSEKKLLNAYIKA